MRRTTDSFIVIQGCFPLRSSRTSAVLTRGGNKEPTAKGVEKARARWSGWFLREHWERPRSCLKGQHVLGSGRLRCPKTYHPTGGVQMPGVPERLNVAQFQGSCPMAAEFHSAAGIPGAGSSSQGRKLSRIPPEVWAAEALQAQQWTEAQVGTL